MSAVVSYRWGRDRNDQYTKQHLYAETSAGHLWPMCEYGWNRSNGHRFSIFRGSPWSVTETIMPTVKGDCRLCMKAWEDKRRPVHRPKGHKTKWL